MFNKQRRRHKPYSIKKTGIKDEFIDRQIIVIHRAIAEKILQDTTLIEPIKARLTAHREQGKIGYGHFINWYSILELIDQPEDFIKAMIEDTPMMRKLRRKTPFVGILNEQERQAAINKGAIATIGSIDVLF